MNHSELPGYLFWMGQDEMEEQMAPDFEYCLAQLKTVSEAAAINTAYMQELVDAISMDYYYIPYEIPISDVGSDFYATSYGKLMGYLAGDAAHMTPAPLAVFHEWAEEKGKTKMEVAVACKSKKPATEEIKKGMTYGGKAMKVIHKGPYESSGAAHEFLHAHIAQSAYDYAGSPWEVYVTGPENEPKEDNWITEIYYPVTPKGEMP